MSVRIFENDIVKAVSAPDYKYVLDKKTGYFERWGETKDDDPILSPIGPEIADIEISSGGGICKGSCKFCYKRNNENIEPLHNMTLEELKIILEKLGRNIGQVAYGIQDISTNPDFWDIIEYTRSQGIMPNYTCNGYEVTEEVAEKTAKFCGAVAVSLVNKQKSFDAIQTFTNAGVKQVNIHYMLSTQTLEGAFKLVDNVKTDPRLKDLKAIVFLSYKHKNKKSPHTSISNLADYRRLIDYCQTNGISYGFDSCGAPQFMKSTEDAPNAKEFQQCAEPCESFGLFSSYVNSKGVYFPCSFAEDEKGWEEGINLFETEDFLKDVWWGEKISSWRLKSLGATQKCNCKLKNICRICPLFDEINVCYKE